MRFFATAILLFLGNAHGALIDRSGGLIYDSDQDITWLQDANFSFTSGYDNDGLMLWPDQVEWANQLVYQDTVRNISLDNWRLPTTLLDDPSCSETFAKGSGCIGSEMGYLSNVYGITVATSGIFINVSDLAYWSGTEYVTEAGPAGGAWSFQFTDQQQYYDPHEIQWRGWAVMDGDVGVIPIPSTFWLFGSAFGLLGWVRGSRQCGAFS